MNELRFVSRGLSLAAIENSVGEADGSVDHVIALHGWLDNAASFLPLMAHLDNIHFIALDLPGHGLSEHKPEASTYNISDDLADVLELAEQLKIKQFHLIGHSRGAIIALLLAASFPERVKSLVLLDGLVPEPVPQNQYVLQLRKHLLEYKSQKSLRPLSSFNEAVIVRSKSTGLIAGPALEALVLRAIIEKEQGWFWRADKRLLYASSFKLSEDQINAVLAAVETPLLFCAFSKGYGQHPSLKENLNKLTHIQCCEFDGTHHAHMEPQCIEKIAARILLFWQGLA